MLTPFKLENCNGHATTVDHDLYNREFIAACMCDCAGGEAMRISAVAFTQALALERLRDLVYQEHGRIVMDRADWKCQNCGAVAALSAHHKVFRSHGRDDRVKNLLSLCRACHEREHGAGVRPADKGVQT